MKIGVLISINRSTDIAQEFRKVRDLDLQSCQVCMWDPSLYTEEVASAIQKAAADTGIGISTLWAGWSGPAVWDFYEGPITLGLVPAAYRAHRAQELCAASDFAVKLGVENIASHVGFLPENPNDPDFMGVIAVLRYVTGYMRDRGQHFLFETGQETPTTLVRAMEEVGTGNIGVNFDTANLILYGKAATPDAARLLAKYVRDVHCKDGLFPTDGRYLGKEVPLGQGRADMPSTLRILLEAGYQGPLTIEREISGEEQIRDILMARDYLRSLL